MKDKNYLYVLSDFLKDKEISIAKNRTQDVYVIGNKERGRIEIVDAKIMSIDYEIQDYKKKANPILNRLEDRLKGGF